MIRFLLAQLPVFLLIFFQLSHGRKFIPSPTSYYLLYRKNRKSRKATNKPMPEITHHLLLSHALANPCFIHTSQLLVHPPRGTVRGSAASCRDRTLHQMA